MPEAVETVPIDEEGIWSTLAKGRGRDAAAVREVLGTGGPPGERATP